MLDVRTTFAWRREAQTFYEARTEAQAPSPREARTEVRSAESAQSAESRHEAPSEIRGGVWGGGSVSPSPRKFLKF